MIRAGRCLRGVSGFMLGCLLAGAASGESRVELLFATTRTPGGGATPAEFLGNEAGPLRYGWCRVAFEGSPREDRWAGYRDFLLPGDERSVEAAGLLEEAAFRARLRAGTPRPVVLFVHGYAYGFARGCRRVSDLQELLGDRAQVVLFSWPSAGSAFAYDTDRASMAASVPALADTIAGLNAIVGSERLRLVSHSMGTQGLLRALENLRGRRPDAALAGNLVLLAPDYERARFRAEAPALANRIGRITLYSSSKDRLLTLSSLVNGSHRLGQGGDEAFLGPEVETVDLSTLPRHHPGTHEYHYFNPAVATDLRELLLEDRPAAQRRLTTPATREGMDYWTLQPPETAH